MNELLLSESLIGFPEWEVFCILLFQVAWGGLSYKLVDQARPGLAISSEAWVAFSFLPHIYERELRRSLTGCAFVVMQTKNHRPGGAAANPSEERLDINALGVDSPRNKGDIVEAKFLAKASSLGFGVARPWAIERYDFVLDSGYGFWRVQVKSNRGGRPSGGFMVKVSGYKRVAYTAKDIDFLVAYLVPEDLWYIVPVKKLIGRQTLFFYPQGRGTSPWEKYREAWCQMACPHDEDGPSKIVTPRCCDKGPTRLPICPLKLLR